MGPKTRTEEELWAADPALMQRAIGAGVDKLYSVYNSLVQLPDWFEPATHGVPLRKSLKELAKTLRSADATGFERLPLTSTASAGGGVSSSPDVVRLQRSLDLVQKERDDLLECKRLGENAVAQLNAKVERLQSELAEKPPSVSDRATLAKLDAANERAKTLEAETAKLKTANLRLREQVEKNTQKLSAYEELGSPRELAQLLEAYRHYGSPDDISDRLGRLHSVASLSKLLVQSMDSACIQYEAIVGPLVLLQERSQRALAAFFSVLDPDNAFDRVNDLSRPLVSAAARLSGTDITLQSVEDAVNEVVQSRGDSDESRGQVSAGELVREYRDLLPTIGDAYGELLLDRRDIAQAYSSLLTQSTRLQDRPMHVPSTLQRATRGTPRLTEDEADDESVYEREAETELSDVSDNDGGESKATESKVRTPPRENISGQFHSIRQPALIARRGSASRKPNLSREALSSERTDVSKHEIQRRAAFFADQKRLRSKTEPWPKGPPSPENRLQIDSRFLREMPWRFQIFGTKEQTAPVKREYTRIVVNDLPDRRFPPLQEVMDLYETQPWRILMHPPGPITFPPDTSRPDLARFYENAVKLFEWAAQALWERTHFILPAIEDKILVNGKEYATPDFLQERRSRHSKLTRPWDGHLEALATALGSPGVDADLLLDRFLLWPPPTGVILAVPKLSEDLSRCIEILDAAEPARLYFCGVGGAEAHAAAFGLSSDRVAALTQKFGRIHVTEGEAPTSNAPSLETPPPKRHRSGDAPIVVDLSESPGESALAGTASPMDRLADAANRLCGGGDDVAEPNAPAEATTHGSSSSI